ncbi:Uncharacterised protein [Mycobacteroides abscessus subsp. massiliense]|nr:Uncharacterised protein [Mycobacteroides abscessus subsp. massiliense]
MQQLGTAAHHAAPLLAHTGQVTRHVHEHDQRDAEGVAQAHETCCLLGAFGVQAAAQTQRVVGQHADRTPGQPAQADDHRGGPLALELFERVVPVEQRVDDRVHVVGALGRLGEQGAQIGVVGLGAAPVENALLAEEADQLAAAGVGVQFIVGDDVAHTRLLVVGIGATQGGHVDVLTGDAADHVGPGDEHAALRRHDDDVGQGRAVCRAAGGEAHDHRDLGDVARGPDHGLEDQPHGVQGLHTLGQPRTAGVPDTHDGALLLDGGVVGVDDVAATLDTHGAAHDGAVGAEGDGPDSVDRARGGQHTRAVTLMQQLDAAVVEEGVKP